MATTTETARSTQVFTKAELDALRKALNIGRNGIGDYASHPPQEGREYSDDWTNDVILLVKFLMDLSDLLDAIIKKRIPEQHRKGFLIVFEKVQIDVNLAIGELGGINGPEDSLFAALDKVGLIGESLLVKLDEFRDRISHGPILAVLGIGDTILGSLCSALHLEPLKELKETIENRIEYGADDEIIQLHLNS
jgi:hypothetical protein